MSSNSINILAVAVGAQAIGFAVFKGGLLQHYAVKKIRNRSSTRNIAHSVQQYITQHIEIFKPDVLAVKQTVATQKDSILVKAAMRRINDVSDKHKLELVEYTPKAVRKALCQSTSASRQDVIATIARVYPELTPFLKRTHKWEQAYYGSMLDAIAVGLVCVQEIEGERTDERN